MINRREMLQMLAGVPFFGSIVGSAYSVKEVTRQRLPGSRNFFKELGVTPIINATGTMTYLSGSRMLPEVMEAINSTSHHFANMYELQDKAGKKIAEMLHCEDAMVTSGAAGALTLGTAACITGIDQEKIHQLPNKLPGSPPEVIYQKYNKDAFFHCDRLSGVKLVEVEGLRQMEQAFNENTVMAHFLNHKRKHCMPPGHFVEVAKRHKIPTLIDMAADVPPVGNLFKYQEIGFDLIAVSGGKMIRGPQSAGLLFGRKDLIEAAKLNDSPHEAPIGRPMKVNKEEIFGMYAALKAYLEEDHAKEWQEWLDRANRITAGIETVPTVKGEIHINPGLANHFPSLHVSWDQTRVNISPQEVVKILKSGTPSIVAGSRDKILHIGIVLLNPDEVNIVERRLKKVLRGKAV